MPGLTPTLYDRLREEGCVAGCDEGERPYRKAECDSLIVGRLSVASGDST